MTNPTDNTAGADSASFRWGRPGQLVSLWDVLQINAEKFSRVLFLMAATSQILRPNVALRPDGSWALTEDSYAHFRDELAELRTIGVDLELTTSIITVDRLLKIPPPVPDKALKALIF